MTVNFSRYSYNTSVNNSIRDIKIISTYNVQKQYCSKGWVSGVTAQGSEVMEYQQANIFLADNTCFYFSLEVGLMYFALVLGAIVLCVKEMLFIFENVLCKCIKLL